MKGRNGDIFMEPSNKVKRWSEYFIVLLNAEVPLNPIENAQYQIVYPMISKITLKEVKIAVKNLKNSKVP